MAANVQKFSVGSGRSGGRPGGLMKSEFQIRFAAGLLFLVTIAASVLGWINFQKAPEFQIPTDGTWWVEKSGTLVATKIEANGPGAKAGIKNGDRLVAINGQEITSAASRV